MAFLCSLGLLYRDSRIRYLPVFDLSICILLFALILNILVILLLVCGGHLLDILTILRNWLVLVVRFLVFLDQGSNFLLHGPISVVLLLLGCRDLWLFRNVRVYPLELFWLDIAIIEIEGGDWRVNMRPLLLIILIFYW